MGGATRMTLTTTVMVMETTGALQLIVPLMITVFVAKARARTSTHTPRHRLAWGLKGALCQK
jgi:chloride channel 7